MDSANWETLERLRGRFLAAKAGTGPYWESEDDLASYHAFFAARIGWKWDNVLEEAARLGFRPRGRRLLDWGCGSGIAALRALAAWGSEAFDEAILWDHSRLACAFAEKTIRAAHPGLAVSVLAEPDAPPRIEETVVLVSHALNELTHEAQAALAQSIKGAAQIVWVEPGDSATSPMLGRQREALRESFDILAPCTRCATCPVFEEGNERHWCHFFGKSPVEAFTQAEWARFAAMLEIDLRTLPYSYLVLQAKRLGARPSVDLAPLSRVIGEPRQFKGYARVLSCDDAGLRDLELQQRDDKRLWKSLKKGKDGALYRWNKIDSGRIKSGQPDTRE